MNRFFAGLLVYVISCSGIYAGCENKSVKTEPPKNQDNATSQTKQNVGSNIAEPTQISVFDQGGRQIRTFVVKYDGHSPIHINLSSLSGGFYLLSVKNSHCASTKSFTLVR